MSFLPASPVVDLATKADIAALKAVLKGNVRSLSERIDTLSGRIDRLQTTLLGGFAAMIAALLAAGFLG